MSKLLDDQVHYWLNAVQAAVIVHGSDGFILAANESAQSLLGIPEKDMIGTLTALSDIQMLASDGTAIKDDMLPVFQVLRSNKPLENVVMGFKHGNFDEMLWLLVSTRPVFDNSGGIEFVVVTFMDITELRAIEHEAKFNEERYHRLFESAPISLWEYDVSEADEYFWTQYKGVPEDKTAYFSEHPDVMATTMSLVRIMDVNQKTLELYKADNKEQIFQNFGTDMIPEELETFRLATIAYLKNEPYFECETVNRTLDGEHIDILYRMTFPFKDEQRRRVLVSVLDITERKKIENERANHIRFLENMERIDRSLHTSIDIDETLENVLSEALDIFQSDRSWLLFPCDPDAEFWSVPMEVTIPEYPGAGTFNVNIPMTDDTAQIYRNALASSLPVCYDNRIVNKLPDSALDYGVLSQITLALYPRSGKPWLFGLHQCSYKRVWTTEEQRQFLETGHRIADSLSNLLLMKTMRENEEKYRTLITSTMEGYMSVDTNNTIIDVNDSLCTKLGFRSENIINHNVLDFIVSTYMDANKRFAGIATKKHMSFEAGLKKKDSSTLSVQINATALHESNGLFSGFFALITDLSEHTQLEEERSKNSKLESVGILAGGIAHDFNNILSVIMGNISLAKMSINDKQEELEVLSEAENACVQAKNLTKQLLTFSKGGAPVKETAYLAEIIKESVTFALRGSNIQCEFELPNDLCPVEIDKGQFHQVLNNLIINAMQAMPEGGRIRVAAENIIITEDDFFASGEGSFVRVDIVDTGHGIKDEHIKNIFDPYYTTKQKGSGLGLATTFSIIRKHGGTITVTSDIGKGSVFSVYLPASEKIPEEASVITHSNEGLTGKILIMDDDLAVQKTLKRMLQFFGNTVDVTDNGSDAIKRYGQEIENGTPYDIVILDLTVPGQMGGREAVAQMIENHGDVNAVVTSGYSNDPVISEYERFGFKDYITKPFKSDDIRLVVNKLLR